MTAAFVADEKILQIAEAYALDAVDFAAEHFDITLDWTDLSVTHIESILDAFHRQAVQDKPTKEKVFQTAKAFGSYIGEVYRRNHGATWGMVTLNGESFPGLETATAGCLFWPWGRASNRITNGLEDNVWHYYQSLVQEYDPDNAQLLLVQQYDPDNAQPFSGDSRAPQKRPWWKRIIDHISPSARS